MNVDNVAGHFASASKYQNAVNDPNQDKAPPPNSPFEDISATLDLSRQLAARICSIAERVLGGSQLADGGEKNSPDGDGTLPRLQGRASSTKSDISDAFRACTRLEQALT